MVNTASSDVWFWDLDQFPYNWYQYKNPNTFKDSPLARVTKTPWPYLTASCVFPASKTDFYTFFGVSSYGNLSDSDLRYEGLYQFDTQSGSYSTVITKPEPGKPGAPSLRAGAFCELDSKNQNVWVYGGFGKFFFDTLFFY